MLQTCPLRLRCVAVLVLALVVSLTWASNAAAQKPGVKPSLADLFKAIGGEKYADAKKHADALLQFAPPDDRLKVSLCYGRILLGLGQKEPAKQYLATMARQDLDANGKQLMAIYGAWLNALEGKPDAGVKTLEEYLVKNERSPLTAEAADVLAIIHLGRGEKDKAKKAVDFGQKFLSYNKNYVTTDYTETLLRNRLKSNIASPEAQKLYEAAEKLRQQGKFMEAGQAFAQLRVDHPKSIWSHAAGFRIGQCFLGLNRPQQALDHWKSFLAEAPAGPWRGQARVGCIDLVLEWKLDLTAAAEHALAATAALGKMETQGAVPSGGTPAAKAKTPSAAAPGLSPSSTDPPDTSWRDVAYDIHLRQGIVSLVDGRFDAAVLAFQQAKAVGGGRSAVDGGRSAGTASSNPQSLIPNPSPLDRLIAAAEKRASVVPDEVSIGDPRATTAVALGTVFSLVRQFERAQTFFNIPLGSATRSRSPAQRSFAAMGLARAIIGVGSIAGSGTGKGTAKGPAPLEQAKTLYQLSLKEFPNGSWHDETLRELALLIEQSAAEHFGPEKGAAPSGGNAAATTKTPSTAAPGLPPSASKGSLAAKTPPAPPTPQQSLLLVKARSEALPYWADLPRRYAASRHAPQALYHAGVLYTEAEKPDEALAAFEQLAKQYPDSPWTGEAQVRLIDVKLERLYDLDGARQHAAAAIVWLDRRGAVPSGGKTPAAAKTSPTAAPGLSPSPQPPAAAPAANQKSENANPKSPSLFPDDILRSLREVSYDIYIRAGLIEYLSEHNDRALRFFEKAKPFAPERNLVVVQGTIPTGIERLIEAAKSNKSLTPEVVRKGDEKARLILMLADVYHEGEQWQQSLDLCTRLINGVAPKATREQKSYAHFRRGRNYYCLEAEARNPDSAFDEYAAAVRAAPKTPWADKAVFLAANIQWNHKHDADRAIVLWRRLCQTYPQSEEADRSAYFIGVAYHWSGRLEEARRAYEDSLKNYPQSRFNNLVKKHLAKLDAGGDRKK